MINLIALKNRIEIIPYDTYIVTNMLDMEHQEALILHFPSHHFREFTLQAGNETVDKNFKFKFEFLCLEQTHPDYLQKLGFNQLWLDLISNITSSSYKENLGNATNSDLSNSSCKIEFTRYRPGDSLDAHYDKQTGKILTQLFYFNNDWNSTWGGYLHVLNSTNINQTVFAVPPLSNYSVLIKPTQNAWHKVGQVSPKAEQTRISMALEFYKQ